MNYRHVYHAGNHGDVLKHVAVLAILSLLRRKPTSLFVLDTHAGRGRYNLVGSEAGKTGEADAGIRQLATGSTDSPAVRDYLSAVMAHNPDGRLEVYPGSPLLIADRLGEHDRLLCCELQSSEAGALKALFAGDRRIGVQQTDGYAALKAILPPRHGEVRYHRGLVLMDPAYEAQDEEFDLALPALADGLRRWPQGVFMLWYPIKLRHTLPRQYRRMAALPMASALRVELRVRPADSPLRLNGSGLLICNPPWGLEPVLSDALPTLRRALGESGADRTLEWLKRPT